METTSGTSSNRGRVALIFGGFLVLLLVVAAVAVIAVYATKLDDKPGPSKVDVIRPAFIKITEGWLGSEGPGFDKKGNLYFTEPLREVNNSYAGRVLKVNPDNGNVTVFCSPFGDGNGGAPAGIEVDQNNIMYVTDVRLGLLRVQPNGICEQVAKVDTDGRALQGCNDLAFDNNGTLWFTAPATAISPAEYKFHLDKLYDPVGSIYTMVKYGEIIRIAKDIKFPNGIAVQHTPDGRPSKLIYAETGTQSLWSHDIVGPGQITNKQLWGKLPVSGTGGFSGPDGMDFDEEGYLLVTNWGGSHIDVFAPHGGDPVLRIKCPFTNPSNLEFRPNSNEVFVTEHSMNGLWRFEWRVKGRRKWAYL